jgi:hypothetical protein
MNKWEMINNYYLQYGLKIFPVKQNGKTPLIQLWQQHCSNDYLQVLYWIETARDCNWGLPATPNNLFIIDLDVHDPNKNGVENFEKLLDSLNFTESEQDNWAPIVQQTPSGGKHIIFATDDELKNVSNGSNVFKDYPGIDVRTDGYIVVQPSEINGKFYGFETIPMSPPKMPKKLKEFILKNAGTKTEHKKTPYEKPKEVYKGNRDIALFEYLNFLYYKTPLDEDEILVLAKEFNNNFDEPLSEKDVKYKIKKAFQKPRGEFLIIRIPEEEL